MYVLYACCFLSLTFPPEFYPWQGGLGNLNLILVEYMWLTLFQLRRRSISIPEKTVYSVRKYLTLPVQIRHPTQASFKIPLLPRQGSNSAPPRGLLCQIPYTPVAYDSQITVGCSAGDVRGRGVMKFRIDERIAARILMSWNGQMFSKYRSLCSRLWFFQFMRKNTWWVELFEIIEWDNFSLWQQYKCVIT